MRSFSKIALAASASVAAVQAADSLCDKYTTALFMDNTGANQLKLLTALVNTAVIGNYTQPNKNAVPGILTPGTQDGTAVALAPYFTGALASSNRGGDAGVSVNFLDGGAAAPLMKNMDPQAGTNEFRLLTHLYQYFGLLLGCTASGFPQYQGETSMYKVHKFMALDNAQVQYFITQVGLAAASFGVSEDDVKTVGGALNKAFGYKCSPASEVVPGAGKQLNSICIDKDCPSDPMADCSGYAEVVYPKNATMSPSPAPSMGGSNNTAPAPSGTAPAPSTSSMPATNAAGALSLGYGALAAVGAAAVMAL